MSTGFYPDALAHLLDEVALVKLRLRLRVTIDRASGRLPKRADLLDRGFVAADGVDAALDDVTPSDADIQRWREAVDQHAQIVAAKIERARVVGIALPLVALGERFGLSALARDMLMLSMAAEIDGGVRQAIAYLQNDITRQHPDLELATALYCDGPTARVRARKELAPDAPLFRQQLLVAGPETMLDDVSILRLPLRAARRVVDWASGDATPDPVLAGVTRIDRCPPGASPLDWMIFSDAELAQHRAAIARAGHAEGAPVVVVLGPEGSGKSALSWAIGQTLRTSVLRVAIGAMERERLPPPPFLWPRIVREARLQDALLAIDGAERMSPEDLLALARAVDRVPQLPVVIEARQPIGWLGERATQRIEVALPGLAERATIWRRELARRGLPTEQSSSLAAKYRVSAGVVQKTLDDVTRSPHASLTEAVNARLAETRDHRLGTLATRITDRPSWDELVLTPDTARDLERLAAQFRHRQKLMVDWGFERTMRTGQGISALFQGPPGTGKTMAASVIAGLFDLELFQIDLSRIVSKWLGETEKNLATIFEEAEKAHAILLFDEADSLFAKRTEVQSSNDRHANLEVNFLLQKMDRFQGITLLTSNFGSSIDEAFLRRLSFRIEFPAPSAIERAALWGRLTPPELEREGDIDFEALGRRFELSGGHIRNAIFKAAINAAEAGRAVSMQHLIDAGNTEYRAIGKIVRADPR